MSDVPSGDDLDNSNQTAAKSNRLSPLTHLLVLAGYTLLTLLMTWPMPTKLASEVIGGGDAWQNIWNLWWVREALVGSAGPQNPYVTDLLYYPDGVGLYLHTLVLTAGLIGIPLHFIGLDLITSYNIILLLTSVLGGYGAFLLCHYITRSRWGSFVGGLVFAFSPYHSAHLYGHMNLASLQWIPFYTLALLKAVDKPRDEKNRFAALRYALLAGALLALNVYTDLVYAVFLAILTAMILIWKVAVPAERREFVRRGVGWGEGALRLAVGGGVALLLVLPVLFSTLAEAGKGYAQQPPRETLVYSSDLTLPFTPSELHPLWGKSIKEHLNKMEPYTTLKHPSERTVFLGYTVLGLAIFGLWRMRRNLSAWMWASVATLTWLFSLGPVLQVMGKSSFTAFGVEVPLPYLLLYKLPLFSILRTPARLVVLTMLALGILTAFALVSRVKNERQALTEHEDAPQAGRGGKWPAIAARYLLPLLILFEFWAAPFSTVPPGWNIPIYKELAAEEGRYGVLELPLRTFSDYMAYQTIHGKPIVGGYLSRLPAYPTLEKTPALRYLLDDTPQDGELRDLVSGGKGVQALRDLNVKYVIIRWWAFTDAQREAMRSKLDLMLGRPPDTSYPEHQVDVWKLYP